MLIKANIWIYVFQLVVMKVSYNVHGLDSIHIRVPTAVTLGSAAVLICECDLPDEDLYSVKWYKGKHEFFRYTSKEIPSIKIFPKAGINVNVDSSNASHVVLASVEPHSSGKYSCEITEAAPSFHTQIMTRDLNVVDLPKTDPVIVDMKPYYGADEFLEIECISNESLPAARLEWLINDRPLGAIQPPSRLEYLTMLPENQNNNDNVSSSSNASTPTSSPSSKKSIKSSPYQSKSHAVSEDSKAAAAASALDGGNSLQHEFAVPVAAAVVASAAALSLTTTSTQMLPAGGSLPQTSASSSKDRQSSRKGFANSRYERSVSRLKLLLAHEHFVEGKIKVKCIARVFDLYERTVLVAADENYPQVRVLSNSDNGVHFSFMSDKDEVSSASSSHRHHSLWLALASRWLLGPSSCFHWLVAGGGSSKLKDTGQSCWSSSDVPVVVVVVVAIIVAFVVSRSRPLVTLLLVF
ncbi:uncharacterized protein LOC129777185 [Toxorhynchites rutilus septentrionalis]|uniref:uncharacterized protein LOC129777185 n=1 Tax=Toxorhynchites rutilus septentrionalis TaxID=329112 RepID=UPI0024792C12|nr:uncharacterized protein LOC129777185 [Toxorhynchites rutilus septentrionalis]